MGAVTLYLRAPGDVPPGIPVEISSAFASEEEAIAQAVNDIQQGNRWHMPQRIENENGNVLMDREALHEAAQVD